MYRAHLLLSRSMLAEGEYRAARQELEKMLPFTSHNPQDHAALLSVILKTWIGDKWHPLTSILTSSDYAKAIEVGFGALRILGFRMPVDREEAAALAHELRPSISTDLDIIEVSPYSEFSSQELEIFAYHGRQTHGLRSRVVQFFGIDAFYLTHRARSTRYLCRTCAMTNLSCRARMSAESKRSY
jgi:hypothetical protein